MDQYSWTLIMILCGYFTRFTKQKLNLPVILLDKNRTKLTIFQQMASQVC